MKHIKIWNLFIESTLKQKRSGQNFEKVLKEQLAHIFTKSIPA